MKVSLARFMLCASLFFIIGIGITSAGIPSWVQPGLIITYDGLSSSVNNGQPVNGVSTLITTEVTSVSQDSVSGSTRVDIPSAPSYGWSYPWTVQEGNNWEGVHRFWLDPANPTGSVKGPNGEQYSIIGQEPYSYDGKTWDATLLAYTNPDTGVEYHLTYESKTGLILASAEKYPSQRTFLFFRSMS